VGNIGHLEIALHTDFMIHDIRLNMDLAALDPCWIGFVVLYEIIFDIDFHRFMQISF